MAARAVAATADPIGSAAQPAAPQDSGETTGAGNRVRRRRRIGIGFILVVALVAGLGLFLRDRGSELSGIVPADEPFPGVSGPRVGGGEISSSDPRFSGKVLVVNAWATWCDPCRTEQPALSSLARHYRERGVAFLGVNYRNDAALAENWITDRDIPYPSVADPAGRLAGQLGFPWIPYTTIVDASGTVRWKIFGELGSEDELAGLIDDVLAGDASST